MTCSPRLSQSLLRPQALPPRPLCTLAMAPKAKPTAAKAAAPAKKPSTPGASGASPTGPRPAPLVGETGVKRKGSDLDQKLVKSLINKFNYDARQGGAIGEEAKAAKAVYNGLAEELRTQFLASWEREAKAGSSSKGWKWVNSWVKTYSQEVKVSGGANSNYVFPGELLRKAGMSFGDFRDDAAWQAVVATMCLDNGKEHGHSGTEVIPHETDPRLAKYFWVEDLGSTTLASATTREDVTRTTGLSDQAWGAACAGGAGESGIKLENPDYVDLQARLGSLSGLISQLQRQVAVADGLCARLTRVGTDERVGRRTHRGRQEEGATERATDRQRAKRGGPESDRDTRQESERQGGGDRDTRERVTRPRRRQRERQG